MTDNTDEKAWREYVDRVSKNTRLAEVRLKRNIPIRDTFLAGRKSTQAESAERIAELEGFLGKFAEMDCKSAEHMDEGHLEHILIDKASDSFTYVLHLIKDARAALKPKG